jgi:hypothetical protein
VSTSVPTTTARVRRSAKPMHAAMAASTRVSNRPIAPDLRRAG